jgi:hypothetical protein
MYVVEGMHVGAVLLHTCRALLGSTGYRGSVEAITEEVMCEAPWAYMEKADVKKRVQEVLHSCKEFRSTGQCKVCLLFACLNCCEFAGWSAVPRLGTALGCILLRCL